LRHRTRNTNEAFSKDSALSMMFQMAMEAQKTYKKISGFERLADIVNGVVFKDGISIEATAI
jgi:putative transposase